MNNKYTQSLHGHPPESPHQYFSEMSAYTPDEETKDQYGQGESLQAFEKELSTLFGQEDCMFVQSGTTAQLIAMRVWADQANNSKIAFHSLCHLQIHEHLSYNKLHNLEAELIGQKNRLITLDDLKNIKNIPSAVILELPQREIGGQVPEWQDLCEQVTYLKSKKIKVHLDGARIWECTSYYGKSLKEISSLFDSTYISFYKGIGAITGAALLGAKGFIDESRIWNRRHGANLFTLFPYYLSARKNLEKRKNSFKAYYNKTLEIAEIISKIGIIEMLPKRPQVNMFHLFFPGNHLELKAKAQKISENLNIQVFTHFKECEKKGFCKVEWYIGDSALKVPNAKIEEVLRELI